MYAFLAALFATSPQSAIPAPDVTVLRCEIVGDPDSRVFELRRAGDEERARWTLAMRGRATGTQPVLLPLPGARPQIGDTSARLSYDTQNGGRHVELTVAPSGNIIDVRANYELEVNVDASLDPRVELMNTNGAIAVSCEVSRSGGSRSVDFVCADRGSTVLYLATAAWIALYLPIFTAIVRWSISMRPLNRAPSATTTRFALKPPATLDVGVSSMRSLAETFPATLP
jgi:hypothetical protein